MITKGDTYSKIIEKEDCERIKRIVEDEIIIFKIKESK
tara:strand:+ start:530 stop:643 length:114 start_codon:yes stop_codon:yes gene_type:complete